MTLDELKAEVQLRETINSGEDLCCDSFDPPATWCWKCLARMLVIRLQEQTQEPKT